MCVITREIVLKTQKTALFKRAEVEELKFKNDSTSLLVVKSLFSPPVLGYSYI